MNTNNYNHKQIFSLGHNWDYKKISIFLLVIALPNILGMLNIDTGLGFKIHFFQLGILVAAMAYGPIGGLMAGIVGSVYSAIIMSNPYIVIGNAILGLSAGYLMRLEWNAILATLTAFAIQLPWLIVSDYYLMSMPITIIGGIVLALLVSNTIWSIIVHYCKKQVRMMA
jgi:hypothetical protein